MREFHFTCLYFQFPVCLKTSKGKNRRTENRRISIGLAKIDRPGNSRYYFMLHPLSGVLHVKRKARKRLLHIRSLDLCHYFTYGPRHRYLSVFSILRGVYSDAAACSLCRASRPARGWRRDETIDRAGDRVTRSRRCVVVNCEMRTLLSVVREQESSSSTISSGSRAPLNCATRLNLHYPIVGTALPSSTVSRADRCAWLR